MLKRIIASAVMATATQATRASKSQPPRMEEVAGGEARILIPPNPRSCSLASSVITLPYKTTVSQTLRRRGSGANFREPPKGEVPRIPLLRRWLHKGTWRYSPKDYLAYYLRYMGSHGHSV